jgi:Putative prokaryotic signal transducing protein
VQIDPEDFKRHYELLSDDALLEMDRDDLVDAARMYYDAELARRKLARLREPQHDDPDVPMKTEPPDAEAVVASFQYPDQLAEARDVLESAAIPFSIRANRYQYEVVVPRAFREQAEQKLRSQFLDPEDEVDYQHHFEELSDEELLGLKTEGLGGAARRMLSEELAQRELEGNALPAEAHGQSDGDLRLVGTFVSLEEANLARGLLQSAGLMCSLENENSEAWSGAGEIRLMVAAPAYDRACEILEAGISEEDLMAQAAAEAKKESAEDAEA